MLPLAAEVKRIVVGADGSPAAEAAVAWACGLACSLGAELVVATVRPVGSRGPDDVTTAVTFPAGLAVRRVVLEGAATQTLRTLWHEEGCDLLVLGSPDIAWYPAPHLSCVSHALACGADLPVAIVPRHAGGGPPGNLVLGVNGSSGSVAATRWLAEVLDGRSREVLPVHATAVRRPALLGRRGDGTEQSGEQLRAQLAPLREAGGDTDLLEYGQDPVTALSKVADRTADSIVVVGGRATDRSHPLRIGSVVLRLLDRSAHPVIIVPPPT